MNIDATQSLDNLAIEALNFAHRRDAAIDIAADAVGKITEAPNVVAPDEFWFRSLSRVKRRAFKRVRAELPIVPADVVLTLAELSVQGRKLATVLRKHAAELETLFG